MFKDVKYFITTLSLTAIICLTAVFLKEPGVVFAVSFLPMILYVIKCIRKSEKEDQEQFKKDLEQKMKELITERLREQELEL